MAHNVLFQELAGESSSVHQLIGCELTHYVYFILISYNKIKSLFGAIYQLEQKVMGKLKSSL